jgi:hypothetical protein
MKRHNVVADLSISAKLSQVARLLARLPLRAALFAMALSLLSVPAAYSQQEVDPTWFNPWPEPGKVISQPSQPRAAKHKPQRKANSVLSDRRPVKPHRKRRGVSGS